ncbi:MAG: amidase [Pseudomonadota bacterium]
MALNTFPPIRQQFLDGTNTPRKHLEATLAAIEALESTLHGFASFCTEARTAADASSARYQAGKPLSALDGCPIGVKDIIETRDAPTQMNSPVFTGWESGRDAPSVHALREAGAVIVGKTHTTEFAIGRSSPAANPYDLTRTPGGSSSGSAGLVGGGLLPIALGTQTAGSILRPASFCGAYGFKPSHGLLSTVGIHPLSKSLDTLGVIAASLEDCWHGVYAMWRWTGSDQSALEALGETPPRSKLRHKRFGWLRTDGWKDLDAESEHAFMTAVSKLREAGADVIDANTDDDLAALETSLRGIGELNTDIVRAEIRYPMTLYMERDASALSERIRSMVEAGAKLDGGARRALLERQRRLRDSVAQLANRFDGFLTMASTGPAPVGLEYTGDRTFLSPWSVIGGPAFSLPALECQNLPVGLQVMGYWGADTAAAEMASWIADQLIP